jgi:hypothetical protein
MEKPYRDLPHEPCRLLRWKAMFLNVPTDPTVPASNDQIYWCGESLTCVGPDGAVASPAGCHPGRTCYDELTTIT